MDTDRKRSADSHARRIESGWCIRKKEGTRVTAEKVQKRTITEFVNASGKVFPEIEVKVSPDISGEITELTGAGGRQR
jgi:HlyD family secretion protein